MDDSLENFVEQSPVVAGEGSAVVAPPYVVQVGYADDENHRYFQDELLESLYVQAYEES